jgi:hypothetical protein
MGALHIAKCFVYSVASTHGSETYKSSDYRGVGGGIFEFRGRQKPCAAFIRVSAAKISRIGSRQGKKKYTHSFTKRSDTEYQ